MTTGAERCRHSRTDNSSQECGAASLPGGSRYLAHADEQARDEFLAGLAPGADLDMRGVPFTPELLARILNAVRDPHDHDRPHFGQADFTRASFSGDAHFTRVSFTKKAYFARAFFSGEAHFVRVSFAKDTNFNEASFSKEAHFIGVSFSRDAHFIEASFTEKAHFNGTSFSRYANFDMASFAGETHFIGVSFAREAHFNEVSFAKEALWIRCRIRGLSLEYAVAEGEIRVEAAAGWVSARHLRAAKRITLRLRSARVDLTELVSGGPVSVHALASPIHAVPDLNGPSTVKVTSLRGVDAESLALTDVDLRECLFAGLHRADQIQLDGDCVFDTGPGRRRILAEEHHWRAQGREERRGDPGRWRPAPRSVEVIKPQRIEVIYRQLRKALEEGKNEPGAADFHYGEMEMRRASAQGAHRLLLWLYWAVSGYGLRARRALAWVLVVAALSIASMTAFGFPQTAKAQKATGTITTPTGQQAVALTIRQNTPAKSLPERLEKAVEVTVNAVIFRSPDTELTTAGRYLNIVVRILGPILLGLAILAIRNQVKR